MRCWNTPKRTPIYSNFTFQTHLFSKMAEHLFTVLNQIIWRRTFSTAYFALWSPITSVIPNHDIDIFLQEKSQIVSMREVNHVLIKHCIWITQYECWKAFVTHCRVFIIYRLSCSCKKHRINFSSPWFFRFYPYMFTLKSFFKNHTHLFGFSKDRLEATMAIKSFFRTTKAFQRFFRFFCYPQYLFGYLSKVID